MEKGAYTIKFFAPGGSADGLKIIEKSNWTGRCVICPRPLFPEYKSQKDFESTGVYILIGPAEAADLPRLYIGEGDPIKPRLNSHYAKKDFWTKVVFFISKDENLNKAHIKYIESRLVGLAKDANRCVLDNGNSPAVPSMSEMDIAEAEGFLSEMRVCLVTLGIHAFSKPDNRAPGAVDLFLNGVQTNATGYEDPEGFVVKVGSLARVEEVASVHKYLGGLRSLLLEREVMVEEGGQYRFTQDYTFSSPSTAAGVILGRSSNGRVEWKNKNGITLKEIQEANSA